MDVAVRTAECRKVNAGHGIGVDVMTLRAASRRACRCPAARRPSDTPNRWLVRLAVAQKAATTLAVIAEAFTAIAGVPAKVLALRTRQNATAIQLGAPLVRQVMGIP